MNVRERLRLGVVTRSADATRALGAELAAALPADATVALEGDLGAGKTTFVQGLARGLGVTEPVTSPTFGIYALHKGKRLLVHLDAYRLESFAELDALMIEEYLVSPYCLAVEWPQKIAAWLPPDALRLTLSITPTGEHVISG